MLENPWSHTPGEIYDTRHPMPEFFYPAVGDDPKIGLAGFNDSASWVSNLLPRRPVQVNKRFGYSTAAASWADSDSEYHAEYMR